MHGALDYRFVQSPYWQAQNSGAREVAAALRSATHFNAQLETALWQQHALPHAVLLRHPFADRRLHEFCLSLGPQHRNRWYAGQNISKFLLRFAYTGDLPVEVTSQEIRSPYAAVSQQFCVQNVEQLAHVFDRHHSILVDLGILDATALQAILASAEDRLTYGQALIRMAGVEFWLQGLRSGSSSFPGKEPSSANEQLEEGLPPYHMQSKSVDTPGGVMLLPASICAKPMQAACILINTESLEVSRLDEEGLLYWQAMQQASSWGEVVKQLQRRFPSSMVPGIQVQALVCQFARELAQAGWIILKQLEEFEQMEQYCVLKGGDEA
jgi:hypothetical protein